jgi:hypothetical protein
MSRAIKAITLLLACAVPLAVTSAALAGRKFGLPGVHFSDPQPDGLASFSGSAAGVRGTADLNEYINCELTSYTPPGPSSNSISCIARHASGAFFSCVATGPFDWNPVSMQTLESNLSVLLNVNTGRCMGIFVDNNSMYPIAQP